MSLLLLVLAGVLTWTLGVQAWTHGVLAWTHGVLTWTAVFSFDAGFPVVAATPTAVGA